MVLTVEAVLLTTIAAAEAELAPVVAEVAAETDFDEVVTTGAIVLTTTAVAEAEFKRGTITEGVAFTTIGALTGFEEDTPPGLTVAAIVPVGLILKVTVTVCGPSCNFSFLISQDHFPFFFLWAHVG